MDDHTNKRSLMAQLEGVHREARNSGDARVKDLALDLLLRHLGEALMGPAKAMTKADQDNEARHELTADA
jgi:hypothetical protein